MNELFKNVIIDEIFDESEVMVDELITEETEIEINEIY